jgi:hypothetical protein
MKRFLIGCAVAAAMVTVGMGSASAGQPAVQGCVGESVMLHARFQQPYGQTVINPNAPRNPFGSIGDAVQLIQAGQVPNFIYYNTCNG